MSKAIIVGGGAAGMAAAVFLAEEGHSVHVFEKNEKLGKKIYITGKGRCNFTNACTMEELFDNVIHGRKFLYSAFYGYNNFDVIDFFESLGVKTKTERGNRVFPLSDHASDITLALEKRMKALGVKVHLKSQVSEILAEDERILGVRLENGAVIEGDAVLVATGGLSYPSTGSTGDGYRFAASLGHKVTKLFPSLVPLIAKEPYISRMQGLSLKNVSLTLFKEKKKCWNAFGELLFTHCGISGPLALTASSQAGEYLEKGVLEAEIDWKPALTPQQLDERLLREFAGQENRQFKNVVPALLPAKAIPVFLELGGISPEKKIHDITRQERKDFIKILKHFPFTITGLAGYNEAVVTKGGVSLKEIRPGTMESKIINGLYFIGEVLDADGLTGGFNLQIAWSTAHAAAKSIQ
ncbi:MAG: NAD(P)/FAD-dependent oxidoreductase [Ruminococcus sp.]|jgi:predicted Rossmann fold flavoprotein